MQTYVKSGVSLVCLAAVAIFAGNVWATDSQISSVLQDANVVKSVKAEVLSSRDKNTRLWEITKQVKVLDPVTGEANLVEVKSYIREKGCGICYQDTEGKLQLTDTSWKKTETGFVMDKANYGLSIGLSAGQMLNYTVDGKAMRLKPASISIRDDNSVSQIAELNASVAGVIDANRPNVLVFKNAFGKGIDLEYSAEPDGYHQNVIFETKPEIPSTISKAYAKIQLYTEMAFDESTASSIKIETDEKEPDTNSVICQMTAYSQLTQISPTKSEIRFVEENGSDSHAVMQFTRSKILGRSADCISDEIGEADKQIVRDETGKKTYLVESLNHSVLDKAEDRIMWDYHTILTALSITTDEKWFADATYYVSNSITIGNNGILRIEPGTVVKFAPYIPGGGVDTGIFTTGTGKLAAKGEPYKYIVFTSSRDNSVGESVDSGTISNWSGISVGYNSSVEFCKVAYANTGISMSVGSGMSGNLQNNIIHNCSTGIGVSLSAAFSQNASVRVFNNLITGAYNGISIGAEAFTTTVEVINNTVVNGGSDYCILMNLTCEAGSATVKNNILSNADTGLYFNTNVASLDEHHNAFYNCYMPIEGADESSTDKDNDDFTCSPFDGVNTQLGEYYLNDNQGGGALLIDTGDIQASSLYESGKWTVKAVIDTDRLLINQFSATADVSWSPTSNCDAGMVDRGYHHPRVDYVIKTASAVNLNGYKLTVAPGTVVAADCSGSTGGGITNSGEYDIRGSAGQEIKFVYLPDAAAGFLQHKAAADRPVIKLSGSGTNNSYFEFAGFSSLKLGIEAVSPATISVGHVMHDCRFNFSGGTAFSSTNASVSVVNCLFTDSLCGFTASNPLSAYPFIQNCTFERNGTGICNQGYMAVIDCLFNNNLTGIAQNGTALAESYNGFHVDENNDDYLNAVKISNQNTDTHDVINLTNADFVSNWTDFSQRFYLPQDDQAKLVNHGSTSAEMTGYSTSTGLTQDTGVRDIGYHYVISPYNSAFWGTIAPVIYVKAGERAIQDGRSWATAWISLHDGLGAAVSGQEIWVATGTYYPGTTRTSTFQLVGGVAVYGGFDGAETARNERDVATNVTTLSGDIDENNTLDSDNSYHVVTGASNATLDGFAVTKGYADGTAENADGAGIYVGNNCSVGIVNCSISENSAANGAGIYIYQSGAPSGYASVDSCVISNNHSSLHGGGIYVKEPATTHFSNTLFTNNTANSNGGGINVEGHESSWGPIDSIVADRCTFIDNFGCYGAGIYMGGDSIPKLTNCKFGENYASYCGGGIYYSNSGLNLINCVFWDNSGTKGGGLWGTGVFLYDSTDPINPYTYRAKIINCTFFSNDARTGNGGAMYFELISDTTYWGMSPTPLIVNSIFWDNEAVNDLASDLGLGCYTKPTIGYCLFEHLATDVPRSYTLVGDAPTFVDATQSQNDGLLLQSGSKGVDAGNNSYVPDGIVNDVIGETRKVDDPSTTDIGNGIAPIVDMGAYEYQN